MPAGGEARHRGSRRMRLVLVLSMKAAWQPIICTMIALIMAKKSGATSERTISSPTARDWLKHAVRTQSAPTAGLKPPRLWAIGLYRG